MRTAVRQWIAGCGWRGFSMRALTERRYFLGLALSYVPVFLEEFFQGGSELQARTKPPIKSFAITVAPRDWVLPPPFQATYRTITGWVHAVSKSPFAWGLSWIFDETILARTEPSLMFFVVAIILGFAVAYASVKPNLSTALPGVAVAVALIPPLAVFGIGVALVSQSIIAGSAVMFFTNIAGMVFAAMVTFSLMDVHHKRFIAESTIKKEDRRVEKETEKVKKIEEETEK